MPARYCACAVIASTTTDRMKALILKPPGSRPVYRNCRLALGTGRKVYSAYEEDFPACPPFIWVLCSSGVGWRLASVARPASQWGQRREESPHQVEQGGEHYLEAGHARLERRDTDHLW